MSFDEVGGLDILKEDLRQKGKVFRHLNLAQSKKCKITIPKGVLIIGMPGCGKSLIAKAIANEFGVSLLRLDVSRLMGQYVGQSEENLRRALATAEAAHPQRYACNAHDGIFSHLDAGTQDRSIYCSYCQ